MRFKASKIAMGTVLGTAAILAAVLGILRFYLDSAFLEEVLNNALVPASKGIYRVELGDLSYSILAGDMVVRELRVLPVRATIDSLGVRGAAPAVQFSARLREVSIRDVEVLRLLWRRELVAGRFSVSGPVVQIIAVETEARAESEDADSLDTQVEDETTLSGASEYLEDLRYLEIGHVEIGDVDASLVLVSPSGRDRNETSLTNRVSNLSFSLENLIIDPTRPQDLQRIAFANDARIDFDQLHLELPEDRVLEIGPFSSSTLDESIQVGNIRVLPTYSEEEMLGGMGPDGDRIELTAGPISFEGLDFRRAFSQLRFYARLAHVESFEIRVLSDKQRSVPKPESRNPAPMPHDVFRDLPFPVTLDSIRFTSASVTYLERSTKAQAPGSISITDIDALITDLSNDLTATSTKMPTRISSSANLFGSVRSWIDIELPLMAPAPTMSVQATFQGFDPRLANSMLQPLEGMRVTKGEVDTAWVDVQYGPQAAIGSVVVVYRDLDVRMEDRDTGKQNLGDKLGSIFADVGLRGGNDPDPGDRPRVGKVDYEIELEKPFFQLFWEAIRGGLTDLVMRF